MRKQIISIAPPEMPIALQRQWRWPESDLHNNWAEGKNFFLIDGELYVEEPDDYKGKEVLLQHWTSMLWNRNKTDKLWPTVRKNGEYLFECYYTDSYETSVRAPSDGKFFVVHTG